MCVVVSRSDNLHHDCEASRTVHLAGLVISSFLVAVCKVYIWLVCLDIEASPVFSTSDTHHKLLVSLQATQPLRSMLRSDRLQTPGEGLEKTPL